MTTEKSPSKIAVIFSGEAITATLLDGSTALVRVRAMPARHLGKVIAACTDEAAFLELVCERHAVAEDDPKLSRLDKDGAWQSLNAEWIDNLTDGSHLALVEAAKRLNFSRAEIWGRRQIEAGQMKTALMTQTDEMLSPVVQKMAHLLISSLKSSGSPAAPSTKS